VTRKTSRLNGNHSGPETGPKAVGLQTRHVFLDTEVYRRYGHNLNIQPLQSFLSRITDQIFTLHITDITKLEIERQIHELAAEVAQALNKANKGVRRWHSRSRWRDVGDDLNDLDARTLGVQGVRDFQFTMSMEWHPHEHQALKLPAQIIFERYFARNPPFDKPDSKEFPDAFVVEALDQWCKNKCSEASCHSSG
jgi:PIN domain